MSIPEPLHEIPPWLVKLIGVLFVGSLIYSVVIGRLFPIVLWLWLLGAGLSVFVVYLLYRFVLAVETIAEKM